MIFIDISRLNISKKWKKKAKKICDKLKTLPDKDRSEFIEKYSNVWKELKPELEKISCKKCWYCETKYDRADFHVDHHRPKNRVKNEDNTTETGYWWLAFDYKNFTLACGYCNCLHKGADGITRGKSDLFPLFPGSPRATTPQCNLNDEIPILLDPTKPIDPSFLWFLQDGKAYPKYNEDNPVPFLRAIGTIKILNLNDPKIVEARKEIWMHCIRLIERGNQAFIQMRRGSAAGTQQFTDVVEEIQELIKSSAEYSATARAYFKGSPYDWVRDTIR